MVAVWSHSCPDCLRGLVCLREIIGGQALMGMKSPEEMRGTEIKAPDKDSFLSPLVHFIEVNCKKCLHYDKRCHIDGTLGLERMMLCMTAQSLGYGHNLACVRP